MILARGPQYFSPNNSFFCRFLIASVLFTLSSVPSVAPTELSLLSSKASVIYVQWKAIPDDKFHGRRLGYRVKYKKYFDTVFSVENVPYGMTSISINDLKAFTLYIFEVEAYTGAGGGPPVTSNMKTPEGGRSIIIIIIFTPEGDLGLTLGSFYACQLFKRGD